MNLIWKKRILWVGHSISYAILFAAAILVGVMITQTERYPIITPSQEDRTEIILPPGTGKPDKPCDEPFGCAVVPVVLNIPEIVGKSKTEVASKIGKPLSCSKMDLTKGIEECKYAKAKTSIVFNEDKASAITIMDLEGVPYDLKAMMALGFKYDEHAIIDKEYRSMRWENTQGVSFIAIIRKENNQIEYAHVRVFPEEKLISPEGEVVPKAK